MTQVSGDLRSLLHLDFVGRPLDLVLTLSGWGGRWAAKTSAAVIPHAG